MRISGIHPVIRLYERGSVSVCGQRGSGKDLLTANVVVRRNRPYVSNVPYDGNALPFDYKKIAVGNNYRNFIEGNVTPYEYPYADGTDIYLSDCGVYFPSQYCNELNRDYKDLPTFLALSRHLGNASVHTNAQDIGRPWDKLREQSDCYIQAIWSKVICGIVFQKIRIYERYDACKARVRPCRIHQPLVCLDPNRKLQIQMYRDNFYNTHGEVEEYLLIYKQKSNYDTRFFRQMLRRKDTDENQPQYK